MSSKPPKPDAQYPVNREGSPPTAGVDPHGGQLFSVSRRRFLEAAGFTFSLSVLNGCSRQPEEIALPFVDQPEGIVPGRSVSYASTCHGCSAGCGLLATVRDGRPLKMEGLPEHPISAGGLCAVGQALPLGLYDTLRLKHPLAKQQESDWADVDRSIQHALDDFKSGNSGRGAVRFVTPTVTSPAFQAQIDQFLNQFTDGRHVVVDPVSSSAILDAHHRTHGVRVLPRYRFENADVVVSLGADFLGTWLSPVEFTAAWKTRRVPTPKHPVMSHHVQLEGRVSLTGSNADRRFRVSPQEYGSLLRHLHAAIQALVNETPEELAEVPCPIDSADLASLANRLVDARSRSLVVSDSQDVHVQTIINAINLRLENYESTLDVVHPSRQRRGNDSDLLNLLDELKAGEVDALFVHGIDLTHNLSDRESAVTAIARVPLVVSFAERTDDFAALAGFVCPDHHPLESWFDSEAHGGVVSITQPLLQPLGNTRSVLESLAQWTGQPANDQDLLRDHWQQHIFPRAEEPQRTSSFRSFWTQALHDGFATVSVESSGAAPADNVVAVVAESRTQLAARRPSDGHCLELYSKVAFPDSRHAHNPWLQELPDPVTKATWDNYACVSQATADSLKLAEGDLVKIAVEDGKTLTLPALIQRGQHDNVVAVALGYGVAGTGRFSNTGPHWLEGKPTVSGGERVGVNAAPLIQAGESSLEYSRGDVSIEKVRGHRTLATTQRYNTLEMPKEIAPPGAEVREIVQTTTLPEFAKNPEAGKPEQHVHVEGDLWPEDHPKTERAWGMTIDLNACTGCSACLVACQSENNVPVVGRDEVQRQREMHWIRIDRYYSGPDDDMAVSHQPMMCQHCDNAPCETVCPVLATVHSDEGLNEQVYNRCVGTRYCANNCPYKVRRFNWFDYPHDDSLLNLALNPDVTVRGRGVMEKCSMCVQRIEQGKIESRSSGQPLVDGQIKTACQQSCPAGAIVFGDLNDDSTAAHAALVDPRRYGVLEEFNFRPSVSYLRVVKNRSEPIDEGDAHA
jgi:Fe-S-cluster-containing dehydrogenase component